MLLQECGLEQTEESKNRIVECFEGSELKFTYNTGTVRNIKGSTEDNVTFDITTIDGLAVSYDQSMRHYECSEKVIK